MKLSFVEYALRVGILLSCMAASFICEGSLGSIGLVWLRNFVLKCTYQGRKENWLCICVLGVIYMCVRGHVYVCWGSCICVLGVSLLSMFLRLFYFESVVCFLLFHFIDVNGKKGSTKYTYVCMISYHLFLPAIFKKTYYR